MTTINTTVLHLAHTDVTRVAPRQFEAMASAVGISGDALPRRISVLGYDGTTHVFRFIDASIREIDASLISAMYALDGRTVLGGSKGMLTIIRD